MKLANRQAGLATFTSPLFAPAALNGKTTLFEASAAAFYKKLKHQNLSEPMTETKIKPTRKNGRHLRVPVLPEEEQEIKENAAKAGLTIAEYLRRLGLGYEIHGVIDKLHIIELSKINADLGRLGGLLKLWLTNDERLIHIEPKTITVVLDRIKATQTAMLEVVNKL